MAKIERRLPSKADNSYFLQFAKNNTSQGGEDGILEELFRLLGIDSTSTSPYCVEIGAWDGKHLSNTYSLLHDRGWGGLLVEANSDRCQDMEALYASYDKVQCECSLVDLCGPSSLVNILDRHNVPQEFEFLSIDIDGADYHLWKSIDRHYLPKVVCIEFNPTITNDVYFIQPPSMDVHQGCSLLALIELGKEMNYTIVVTTLFNAIFVRNDLMNLLPAIDNSINTLHIPQMSTSMFQTYEGELVFVGTKKLLWHRLAMNPQKLQVLSKRERHFPFAPNSASEVRLIAVHKCIVSIREAIDSSPDSVGELLTAAMSTFHDALRVPSCEGVVYESLSKLCFSYLYKVNDISVGLLYMEIARCFSTIGQSQVSSQPSDAEKFIRFSLSLLKTLLPLKEDGRNKTGVVARMYVEVGVCLARALRLQDRPLESTIILREMEEIARQFDDVDMESIKHELAKCVKKLN